MYLPFKNWDTTFIDVEIHFLDRELFWIRLIIPMVGELVTRDRIGEGGSHEFLKTRIGIEENPDRVFILKNYTF